MDGWEKQGGIQNRAVSNPEFRDFSEPRIIWMWSVCLVEGIRSIDINGLKNNNCQILGTLSLIRYSTFKTRVGWPPRPGIYLVDRSQWDCDWGPSHWKLQSFWGLSPRFLCSTLPQITPTIFMFAIVVYPLESLLYSGSTQKIITSCRGSWLACMSSHWPRKEVFVWRSLARGQKNPRANPHFKCKMRAQKMTTATWDEA